MITVGLKDVLGRQLADSHTGCTPAVRVSTAVFVATCGTMRSLTVASLPSDTAEACCSRHVCTQQCKDRSLTVASLPSVRAPNVRPTAGWYASVESVATLGDTRVQWRTVGSTSVSIWEWRPHSLVGQTFISGASQLGVSRIFSCILARLCVQLQKFIMIRHGTEKNPEHRLTARSWTQPQNSHRTKCENLLTIPSFAEPETQVLHCRLDRTCHFRGNRMPYPPQEKQLFQEVPHTSVFFV